MRRITAALVMSLTICLSSCATQPAPVLVRPQLEIPERPEMLPVAWNHENGQHCLTESQAKNLLINIERLNTHIAVLEGYIKAASED